MRTTDTILMALALFAGPGLSWLFGRFAGRRDTRLMPVILISVAIAGILDFVLLSRPWAAAPAPTAAGGQVIGYEFAAFLPVFGIFLAMLGWASVPARMAPVETISASQEVTS